MNAQNGKAILRRAEPGKLDAAYGLILERVAWMDRVGLQQWNNSGYLEAYPRAYFGEQLEAGRLYVLEEDGEIVATAVLLDEDPRWADFPPESAWYIHNFASSVSRRGAGGAMLDKLRERATELGKRALRLDCARDSAFLNEYYEKQGYRRVGECCEGPYYQGVLRQLRLDGESPVGNS